MFKAMTLEEMDEAAKQAEEELKQLDQKSVEIVANWWINWYMKAGHKRLGRILVKKFK
jgi:hypothetical protein